MFFLPIAKNEYSFLIESGSVPEKQNKFPVTELKSYLPKTQKSTLRPVIFVVTFTAINSSV